LLTYLEGPLSHLLKIFCISPWLKLQHAKSLNFDYFMLFPHYFYFVFHQYFYFVFPLYYLSFSIISSKIIEEFQNFHILSISHLSFWNITLLINCYNILLVFLAIGYTCPVFSLKLNYYYYYYYYQVMKWIKASKFLWHFHFSFLLALLLQNHQV
jgi:hypothetical protein